MLSIRRLQVMAFTVLVALLISTAGVHAHHVNESDWWLGTVFWKISTGKHDWGSLNTHSWHRVFVRNESLYNLTVEYWWEHDVIDADDDDVAETDDTSGVFTVEAPEGEQETGDQREGWLGPDITGLDNGWYKIKSTTKMKITNDKKPHNQTTGTKSISKTSVSFWIENDN